jgi:hypothetical protein
MPDMKYKEAYWRMPEVEAKLAAAEQRAAELLVELKIAVQHTDTKYTLLGHYMRVMAKYFSPDQPKGNADDNRNTPHNT